MDKRHRVSGLFILEVEAEDSHEASRKAERIMRDSGIEGHVIEKAGIKLTDMYELKEDTFKERGDFDI